MWLFVSTNVVPPASNPIALEIHEVKKARTPRILLDGVRDYFIPHLAEKQRTKEMWKSLYKKKTKNGKMTLKTSSIGRGWPRVKMWPFILPGSNR